MEKKHHPPGHSGHRVEQESFEEYANPRGSDINPSDPKYDPQVEEQTHEQPEIEPVRDDQETKSPLRPIDENKSPHEFGHPPLGSQQPATHGSINTDRTDNPSMF